MHVRLGGIQQLRGQEEGEGGSAKSPRLSTQGWVHLDQNLVFTESMLYHCALEWVIKKIDLNLIELFSYLVVHNWK